MQSFWDFFLCLVLETLKQIQDDAKKYIPIRTGRLDNQEREIGCKIPRVGRGLSQEKLIMAKITLETSATISHVANALEDFDFSCLGEGKVVLRQGRLSEFIHVKVSFDDLAHVEYIADWVSSLDSPSE